MKITYFDKYNSMSNAASNLILEDLKKKPDLFICVPTGGSPFGLYANLAMEFSINRKLFDKINLLKLDEWGGIPMKDPNSCHSYLLKHLLEPLKIESNRYIGFDNSVNNAEEECRRVQKEI